MYTNAHKDTNLPYNICMTVHRSV